MAAEKKLVDEVSGWLRIYDDGSVDREFTGPPQVKFMADPVPPHHEFINGVATKDVTIDESSGLRVRIYTPRRKPDTHDKLLPVLLHFHGGGFCISQADWFMYYHVYAKLTLAADAICVSVYFPLAPEHRLPAAIESGFSALLWLRSLSKLESHEPWLHGHADFSRVFLIGDSTGGNIAHEIAARAGRELAIDPSPVQLAGAVMIHPGFIREARSRSEMEQPESPMLTLKMVDKFLSLALPVGATKDHPITCPMGPAAVAMESLKMPAVLVCVAEREMMVDTQMEYVEAMRKAGKEVEVLMSKGMTHSFYLNKIAVDMDVETKEEAERLVSGIVEFVGKH